jgi:FMNH2-dependent dimethyl sulfone monooxygenase
MAAFGIDPPIGRDQAYDMADEFVCLMKHLWWETERFDFEGRYYQSRGALVAPRPTRKPRPVLMNAALSDKGIDFGVRHCDWIFTEMPTLEAYRERASYIHKLAAGYGRQVRVATMCWVVAAPTDHEAKSIYDWIEAEIDHDAVLNFINSLSSTREARLAGKTSGAEPWGGVGRERFVRIALGIMSPQIVGSYQTVAEQLRALHDTGLESLLICFFDPQKGLHQMQDDIIPILKKMGLRK